MLSSKKALRTDILAWRKEQEKIMMLPSFCEVLVAFIKERGFQSVGLYEALRGEVDLSHLKEAFIQHGISYALPIIKENNAMIFQQVGPNVVLEKKSFGIFEPEWHEDDQITPDCLFVPGLSFDRKGNRLGFGQGHYDRYLENLDIYCIGVCADQQLHDEIPHEAHDRGMDIVITQNMGIL